MEQETRFINLHTKREIFNVPFLYSSETKFLKHTDKDGKEQNYEISLIDWDRFEPVKYGPHHGEMGVFRTIHLIPINL